MANSRQGFGIALKRSRAAGRAAATGQGTVTIDDASFAGIWRRGCPADGDKRIAIGVPLSSCGGGRAAENIP